MSIKEIENDILIFSSVLISKILPFKRYLMRAPEQGPIEQISLGNPKMKFLDI